MRIPVGKVATRKQQVATAMNEPLRYPYTERSQAAPETDPEMIDLWNEPTYDNALRAVRAHLVTVMHVVEGTRLYTEVFDAALRRTASRFGFDYPEGTPSHEILYDNKVPWLDFMVVLSYDLDLPIPPTLLMSMDGEMSQVEQEQIGTMLKAVVAGTAAGGGSK